MKKYGGLIKNWQVHNLSFTQEDIEKVYPDSGASPMVFTGTVVRDNPKLKDGSHTRSSLIVAINEKRTQIETLNTIYDVMDEGYDVVPEMGDNVMKIFY